MARALMEDKKEWRLKEVDNKKKNYGNRALLGDKRGPINDIEAPKALDVQLGGLHIEPSEANFVLAAILNGGKKDYHQY